MKLIELHILQSYPVSCLNRDDVGSPKSALFGGTQRARVSSQSQKRAARMHARENFPEAQFHGIRSRFLLEPFRDALVASGVAADEAEKRAQELITVFSKQDAKKPDQVTTAVFLSPGEIEEIAKAVANGEEPKKAAKKATRLDAADIALFGRMVANDPTLNVEGAAMFSHALSTHETANDIDFYSAVDDRKTEAEDAGAGMIGTLEFNSATYYRYVGLNLNLLNAPTHLGPLPVEKRRAVVDAFLRSCLLAVPSARRNSMNANTLPYAVLGLAKDKGQPLQLINAFEEPVRANGQGVAQPSRSKLAEHHELLKKTWGIQPAAEVWLPDTPLDQFIDTLLAHV